MPALLFLSLDPSAGFPRDVVILHCQLEGIPKMSSKTIRIRQRRQFPLRWTCNAVNETNRKRLWQSICKFARNGLVTFEGWRKLWSTPESVHTTHSLLILIRMFPEARSASDTVERRTVRITARIAPAIAGPEQCFSGYLIWMIPATPISSTSTTQVSRGPARPLIWIAMVPKAMTTGQMARQRQPKAVSVPTPPQRTRTGMPPSC